MIPFGSPDRYPLSTGGYFALSLSMLTTEHIKCVAFKLDHHKGVIQNRSGYVLSTLFNITEHTQKQARELLEYLIEKDKEKDEED